MPHRSRCRRRRALASPARHERLPAQQIDGGGGSAVDPIGGRGEGRGERCDRGAPIRLGDAVGGEASEDATHRVAGACERPRIPLDVEWEPDHDSDRRESPLERPGLGPKPGDELGGGVERARRVIRPGGTDRGREVGAGGAQRLHHPRPAGPGGVAEKRRHGFERGPRVDRAARKNGCAHHHAASEEVLEGRDEPTLELIRPAERAHQGPDDSGRGADLGAEGLDQQAGQRVAARAVIAGRGLGIDTQWVPRRDGGGRGQHRHDFFESPQIGLDPNSRRRGLCGQADCRVGNGEHRGDAGPARARDHPSGPAAQVVVDGVLETLDARYPAGQMASRGRRRTRPSAATAGRARDCRPRAR